MTSFLHDFSQRRELEPQAQVVGAVVATAAALNVPVMITGAFARDLLLHHAHAIPVTRQTEDVDFALAVADWAAFNRLKQQLIASGQFRDAPGIQQRLYPATTDIPFGIPVDLVPFDGVETDSRQVDWPPGNEFRMDVFGFREALATARWIRLPGEVEVQLVSLPALALLKLVAWQDRHYRAPKKDGFDYVEAGARLLGVDIAALLDEAGITRVSKILTEQSDTYRPGLLPQEMSPDNNDLARTLLEQMLAGLNRTEP